MTIKKYGYTRAPLRHGTVQFSASTYAVDEDGLATITVTRTGGNVGPASVDYATSNGTATAGVDYTATSGTFEWEHEEDDDKTFSVPITADLSEEGDETVNLTLSGVTGADLGEPSTAVLTINDDDTYTTVGNDFNGVTSTSNRGAAGAASANLLLSFWFKRSGPIVDATDGDGLQWIFSAGYQTSGQTQSTKCANVWIEGDGVTENLLIALNSSASGITYFSSESETTGYTFKISNIDRTGWNHVAVSAQIYLAPVAGSVGEADLLYNNTCLFPAASLFGGSGAGGQFGFNSGIWRVGAFRQPLTSSLYRFYTGCLADILLDPTRLDLSQVSNQRLLIKAGGTPADIGDGTPVVGHPALVVLKAGLAQNDGTGGDFFATDIELCDTSPTD